MEDDEQDPEGSRLDGLDTLGQTVDTLLDDTDERDSPPPASEWRPSRRRVLQSAGAMGFISGLGGLGRAQNQDEDLPEAWEEFSLAEQLEILREATEPYKQLDAVVDDGYVNANLPLYCGLGYHFDNESVWENPPQPTQPGSLFYLLSDDGQLMLGGVEYLFVTDTDDEGNPTNPQPDVFNDENESLDETPLAGTREADSWELIEDPATGKFVWDLHVWVHIDNTDGLFEPRHPDFEDMPGCVQPPV